jgi:rRNA processing protein Krr1/Pno1
MYYTQNKLKCRMDSDQNPVNVTLNTSKDFVLLPARAAIKLQNLTLTMA